MSSNSKTDFQKYVEWREQEKEVNRQLNIQEYTNWSEQYKQDYWDRKICGSWWHSEDYDFPINLVEFREEIASLEDNFDRFIPWIMLALEDLGFTWDISDIFILDEQAKEYLEIHWNLAKNSEQVWSVIDWDIVKKNKTSTIEWINFSFEELAKRMWDLFYEPLASMLNSIAIELEKQIDSNEEVVRLLKEACNHILKAWDHCKPYVIDINELEKKSKHTFDIKDTSLSNEQISRAIAYLENRKLKEFLELLSAKIYKDWEADKWRWRIKLSNELFASAEKLKQSAELL